MTFFVVEVPAECLAGLQRGHEWTQKTLFVEEERVEREEKTLLVREEQREGDPQPREGRDGALEGTEKALVVTEKMLEGQQSMLEVQKVMLRKYSQLLWGRETITAVREARI